MLAAQHSYQFKHAHQLIFNVVLYIVVLFFDPHGIGYARIYIMGIVALSNVLLLVYCVLSLQKFVISWDVWYMQFVFI